ncbi:MAG: MYXO-CTERM sorting domain-containing protein [Myxococcota bacterium]
MSLVTAPGDASAAPTVQEWDDALESTYPNAKPLLDRTDGNDDHQFAWQGHFWLRAYLRMASLTGDTRYLDDAVELIDHMWAYSDPERVARGEIAHDGYVKAPVYHFHHDEVAPGWRFPEGERWRIEALTDGMILQGMTRFVYVVERDDRFVEYRPKAAEYLPRIEEVLATHDENYSYDRNENNAGSYYYTAEREDSSYDDPYNDRIWGDGKPYNHNACVAVSLILLDDLYGRPEYRRKAQGILQFWKDNHWVEGGDSYAWYYHLLDESIGGVEDVEHASLDVDLLMLSHNFEVPGLDDGAVISDTDLDFLVGTVRRFTQDDGNLTYRVDGTNDGNTDNTAIGYGWIELARHDPEVYDLALFTFEEHVGLSWSRTFLGWANLLWLDQRCEAEDEVCDGVDNDCDGWIDEGVGCIVGEDPGGDTGGGGETGGGDDGTSGGVGAGGDDGGGEDGAGGDAADSSGSSSTDGPGSDAGGADDEGREQGCGCASGDPGPGLALLVPFALFLLRRRTRDLA